MKLLETKPISFREVNDYLKERKKEAAGGELGYEQANSLDYSEKFLQLTDAKERDLRDDLSKLGLQEPVITGLVDMLPKKEDEIKLILQSGKLELPDDQVKEIAKVVKKYRK
jgi:DNA-directed RNA polymerase subunit F